MDPRHAECGAGLSRNRLGGLSWFTSLCTDGSESSIKRASLLISSNAS